MISYVLYAFRERVKKIVKPIKLFTITHLPLIKIQKNISFTIIRVKILILYLA
jgi:hypothetical protein